MGRSTRGTVSKLVPPLPKVPGVSNVAGSRRQRYSASTKRTLVEVAERLFTEQGYAATSLDQVVAGAEVTKGALYHHFSGKQALFEAVFEQVEDDAGTLIQTSLADPADAWDKAMAGLRAFLGVVQEARYRRIVIQEGPAVLGYERFRDREERSTFPHVVDIVRSLLEAGSWDLDEDTLETFARIFFGAMSSAGESVAAAEDRESAAARVEDAIGFILAGFRVLALSGEARPGLPDAFGERPLLDPDGHGS